MDHTKPSKQELQRKIKEFASSGLTRGEFSRRSGIPVTTLDYWRRVGNRRPRLMEVAVVGGHSNPGFTMALNNGRRIESSWGFSDAELMRLIRVAESA
jgi:hypothetical protein